jgi:hypothetical protein
MKMTGAQSLCGVFLLASASAGFAQEGGGANVVRKYYQTLQQSAPELLTEKTKHQLDWEIKRLEFDQEARNKHSNQATEKHSAADTDEEEDVEYYLDE